MAIFTAPRALTQEMEPENDNIYGQPQVEMQNSSSGNDKLYGPVW